jgi:hypothetical protein
MTAETASFARDGIYRKVVIYGVEAAAGNTLAALLAGFLIDPGRLSAPEFVPLFNIGLQETKEVGGVHVAVGHDLVFGQRRKRPFRRLSWAPYLSVPFHQNLAS